VADYESELFGEYVNACESRRLELERLEPYAVGLYEHGKCWAPWSQVEAKRERAIARRILWDPTHAASHHGDWSKLARDNCSACVLSGSSGDTPPNYAGWHRIYVQAGAVIPDDWRPDFAALLKVRTVEDGNLAYADALGRDVVTFGLADPRGVVTVTGEQERVERIEAAKRGG